MKYAVWPILTTLIWTLQDIYSSKNMWSFSTRMRKSESSIQRAEPTLSPCAALTITLLTHHVLFPAKREGLLKHNFNFHPSQGSWSSSSLLSTHHMRVIKTCAYQLHSIRSDGVGREGGATITAIWGFMSRSGIGSMEFIKSHVNKCQLKSQWNIWGRRQQLLPDLWAVLMLSALWLIEKKKRWSPACGQPPGSY